jgi:hypothetical protein
VTISHEHTAPVAALLVDYPTLLRAIRASEPDAAPSLALMVARAGALGPLLVARAYGAWYDLDEARSAFAQGIDPSFVPALGAGGAPTTTALVADGVSLIRSGQVSALALSGDDRLLPLVAVAHAEGVAISLVAHSCAPGGPCLRLAASAEPAAAFVRTLTRAERYRRSVA